MIIKTPTPSNKHFSISKLLFQQYYFVKSYYFMRTFYFVKFLQNIIRNCKRFHSFYLFTFISNLILKLECYWRWYCKITNIIYIKNFLNYYFKYLLLYSVLFYLVFVYIQVFWTWIHTGTTFTPTDNCCFLMMYFFFFKVC